MSVEKPSPLYPVTDETASVANEAVIPGGFVLMARKIDESEIAHAAPHVREIWRWLIIEANHKPYKTSGKTIERGQLLTTYSDIQNGLHWYDGFIKKTYKKHQVDNAMRWLRQHQMVTTHKTTRGMVVTICKYGFYQNPKNYEYGNGYDSVTTVLRQRTDRINKNEKNDKNGKLVAGADAPTNKTFKQWDDKEFVSELSKFKEYFPKDMLNAFYKYWTEKSASGKMKFQLETTWETKRRLENWQRIEESKRK